MYCAKCGENILDEAVFCSRCGAARQANSPTPATNVTGERVLLEIDGKNDHITLTNRRLISVDRSRMRRAAQMEIVLRQIAIIEKDTSLIGKSVHVISSAYAKTPLGREEWRLHMRSKDDMNTLIQAVRDAMAAL